MAINPQLQPTIDALAGPFKEQVRIANSLAAKIIAATSGIDEKVDEYLATSDDEQIVKFRDWLAQAEAKVAEITEKIKQNTAQIKVVATSAVSNADDAIDVDAVKAEFMTARQNAHATKKAIEGFMGNDADEWNKFVESHGIVEVVSLAKGGKRIGATGIKRPRLGFLSLDGTAYEKPAFGPLAKDLGLATPDVQDAAFKAAGTDDLSTVAGQEFTMTIADKDGENHTVVFASRKDEAAKSE